MAFISLVRGIGDSRYVNEAIKRAACMHSSEGETERKNCSA